jgi:filamentous hemagglutinin family protein
MMKRFILLMVIPFAAAAEVVTDGTTGGGATTITADGANNYQIDATAGDLTGGNLFHSFTTFNVEANHSATFSGPTTVDNIVSRVTGGQASQIDGKIISDIPGANLWLINKNGVHFGDEASVDVDGAFHAGTASYVGFADGARFYADPADGSSILTAAQPEAFGFLTTTPPLSSLTADNARISVGEDTSITLVAHDIQLQSTALEAPSGNINIISVDATGGEILLIGNQIDTSSLNGFGSIEINDTALNVSGRQQGNVVLKAADMEISTHEADFVNSFTVNPPNLLEVTDVMSKPCGLPAYTGQGLAYVSQDSNDGDREFTLEVNMNSEPEALEETNCVGQD